jgi:hypothetical protein
MGFKISYSVAFPIDESTSWERNESNSRTFESQQRVSFRDIMTGGESRFLQQYDHQQNWCVSADEVSTKVTHTRTAQKTMLLVFLSIHGAIFISRLPPGEKINSGYFCEQIIGSLSEILHGGRTVDSPGSIVHLDNAAPRRPSVTENCFQSCQFRHAPQPPDSPEISPRGFSIQ